MLQKLVLSENFFVFLRLGLDDNILTKVYSMWGSAEMFLRNLVKSDPCKHTTLFQRLYNVHNVVTTSLK